MSHLGQPKSLAVFRSKAKRSWGFIVCTIRMCAVTETPLWLQGRDAVIAAAAPEDWRHEAPDYHLSHEVMPAQRTHQFDPSSKAPHGPLGHARRPKTP